MSSSSLSSWARLIWDELNSRQLDANSVFRQADLDPTKLNDSAARFPMLNMAKLWELARSTSGDECFGIEAGSRWNPSTFHALGFAWLASNSLGEALHRFARYGDFVIDGMEYELVADKMLYYFRIRVKQQVPIPLERQHQSPASDAAIAAILKMIRMLMGESFNPRQIICPHPPNGASLMLEMRARCPVHYGGDAVEFVFDRQDIERKLTSGNNELSQANEQIILKHLADLDKDKLGTQIQLKILELLPSGHLREEDIASKLGMSTRTMQRRLADEGLSFSQLLQEARQKLTDQYIRDHSLSINEIAYLLGFSDQANFTRAFKRWHGISPTEFRQREKD